MVDETKAPDAVVAAPVTDVTAPLLTPEISSPSNATPAVTAPAEAADSLVAPAETKVETKVEAPVDNVLGAEPTTEKKVETKPDTKETETKAPVEGEKPADAPKVETPVYDEFKLPENVKLEKEPLESFTKILGEIETGKLDHKGMQEKGQALIDLAAKNTIDSITRLNDYYVQLNNSNIQKRVDALKADPVLGGDKFENTVSAIRQSVVEYGGTEAQIAEFRKEITDAGLGASPAVVRLIHNMQQKINKYTTESNGPSIVPGAKPAPTKVKPYEAFYRGGAA